MFRTANPAPVSRLDEARRGRRLGTFCLVCGSVYPLHHGRHAGKPLYGKDHVSAPCPHEGDLFEAGEDWWEPALEVLPAPPEPEEAEEAVATT